jgi:FKBP-type peptidyl-prolyl cis-trans isomerase (trigger factor)
MANKSQGSGSSGREAATPPRKPGTKGKSAEGRPVTKSSTASKAPAPKGAPPAKAGTEPSDHRHASLEAGRALQRLLAQAPGAQKGKSLDPSSARAAEAVLKNAANIEIHVPVANPVSPEDVKARIDELRIAHARVERRRSGDVVTAGDEVELTLTGYVGGKVFLAKVAEWYWVRPNSMLPGFFESLIGAVVGEPKIIQVRLPANYPVPAYANRLAVFAIDVRGAQRRLPPDAKDPTFLAWVGRGKTLDALEKALSREILSARANDMVQHAKLLFLRELYHLSEDPIPEEFVEDELRKSWRAKKGEALIQLGVSLDEQKESQAEFMADPVLREEARRAVWELRVLESIADHTGIEASDEQLNQLLSDTAAAAEIPERELMSVLERNEAMRKGLQKNFRINQALTLLLSKGRIFFDAPPTPPELARAKIGQKRKIEATATPVSTPDVPRKGSPLAKGLGGGAAPLPVQKRGVR